MAVAPFGASLCIAGGHGFRLMCVGAFAVQRAGGEAAALPVEQPVAAVARPAIQDATTITLAPTMT